VLAAHEHSRSTVTRALPIPPVGPNVVEDAVSEGWQRMLDGEVMFVDVVVDVPQATRDSAAANTYGRARTAPAVTLGVNAQDQPVRARSHTHELRRFAACERVLIKSVGSLISYSGYFQWTRPRAAATRYLSRVRARGRCRKRLRRKLRTRTP
jgi:hypothetical protein